MTPEVTVSLSLIFAVVGLMGTVLGMGNMVKNNNEKETEKRLDIEKQFVGINIKLDNLTKNISDLVKKNDDNMSEIQEITKSMVLENERIETLFRYKDDHENRIKDMEMRRNNDERN